MKTNKAYCIITAAGKLAKSLAAPLKKAALSSMLPVATAAMLMTGCTAQISGIYDAEIVYENQFSTPIVLAIWMNAEDEVTAQDVMDLMEDAHEDVIDDDQKEMIENIFELDDMTAGDIMTHRTDVFAFNGKDKCADIVEQAVESGFSRIPVYDGTIDTIAGILYTKDLLTVVGDDEKLAQPVKTYVRKAMFVPEACAARELLVQFKLTRNQMAVVVDEYGGTSGIITMEDILEEIVGNIQDEYDDEEEMYILNEDDSYTCNASMELEDLLELFDIEVDEEELEEEDFDSIGGLIIDRLGRIPSSEEAASVEYKGLVFTVTDVADRRILKVKVERKYPIA